MTPALVRSRRRSRPSGHRRKRRTEGLRPSEPPPKGANSPLLKPPFCRPSHVTVFLGVVVSLKILTPKNAGFSYSRHSQGKGRWSRASIDPYPSLSFGSTAASIPQSVNEVSVDPLRGTTPPPWSRIAPLTRLLFRTRLSHVPCACVRRSGSCRDSSARESSCSRR